MKNTTCRYLGIAVAAMMALPAASFAQGMGQQQGMGQSSGMSQSNDKMSSSPSQQQGQQGQAGQAKPGTPATPPAAPAIDPAEEAAYKALMRPGADAKRVALEGEAFLVKYNSNKDKPSTFADRVYGALASAYMNLNDTDKMTNACRMALTLNPNNVDVLAIWSMASSRRLDPSRPDAKQQIQSTEDMARHGIELLNVVVKPEGITDEEFLRNKNEKLAMCHSGLGLAEYNEGKFTEAASEFDIATKLETPPDSVDLYLLGVSSEAAKLYPAAVAAYQACAKEAGPMQERCQTSLAEAKKLAATQLSTPKQ